MSAHTLDCPPLDACGPCGTLPAGFLRLRYFYGKRMGVADFLDEQRYHVGKRLFHNQRAHGAGLLCGLGVTRESTTDLILRVGKGAALDSCGREIVVGYDQCIDVQAWFQRELEARRELDSTWPSAALDGAGELPLLVLIRYRDCSTAPEPAPRDTCACDASGCDFGRIREEFELALVPANELAAAPPLGLTPPRPAVETVLGHGLGGAAIWQGLAAAAALGCPETSGDGWLRLASFNVVLGGTSAAPLAADLGPVRSKASLLAQTALLQDLLSRAMSAQLEAGSLNDGPEVVGLSLEAEPGPSTFVRLYLELSAPVIAETVPSAAFTLSVLSPSTAAVPGWSAVACQTTFVAATATTPPRLQVRVDNAANPLSDGGMYRLALDPAELPAAAPIADDEMRPLRPLRGVFQFGISKPAADLVLIDAPYAR